MAAAICVENKFISNLNIVKRLLKALSRKFKDTLNQWLDLVPESVEDRNPDDPYDYKVVIRVCDSIVRKRFLGNDSDSEESSDSDASADSDVPVKNSSRKGKARKEELKLMNLLRLPIKKETPEVDIKKEVQEAVALGMSVLTKEFHTMLVNIPKLPPAALSNQPPNANWMMYQYRNQGYKGGNPAYTLPLSQGCYYCGQCSENIANCKVKAKVIADGVIKEEFGVLTMCGTNEKIRGPYPLKKIINDMLARKESDIPKQGMYYQLPDPQQTHETLFQLADQVNHVHQLVSTVWQRVMLEEAPPAETVAQNVQTQSGKQSGF
ncbi:hypothetical protein BDQ17DRAFT_1438355 [Cyathus striatus]|nr:hypothetical protein BDQ17DRAFT_1438355 [Cyathus striatus]